MKRVLITGASRGIGRAIALELAGGDFDLLIHGRNQKHLAETQRLVVERGGRATAFTCDFSQPAHVQKMVRALADEPLDVLINNAGLGKTAPLEKIALEDWNTMFAVNVTAPMLLIQGLSPHMPRGAMILNILSVSAKIAYPTWGKYTMTKFAMNGFALAVREELRPKGIRVVNIYPGASDTEIWNDVEGPFHRDKMMSPDNTAAAVRFVLDRPEGVLIEDITFSNLGRIDG